MRIRNFTWADLPALDEFINMVRLAAGDERTLNVSSLKDEMGQPGLAPQDNCTLFEDADGLKAYSLLHPELRISRSVLELAIHPAHAERSDIEEQIVRSGVARAKALSADLLHICVPPSKFWRRLLEGEGFSKVRHYWLMRWQDGVPLQVEAPEGFTIESFQPGDEGKLTRVQNASFEGSWGFCPNTIEEVTYRANMTASASDGILFLNHGDEVAGYCWACIQGDQVNPIGTISMIGIAPGYRGRGLSRPILVAAMKSLRARRVKYVSLDVDRENGPAISLYASVGFKRALEIHWFEMRFSES